MQKKNNTASFWRKLRVSLFPIRDNWRFWIGLVVPAVVAACWPWFVEPDLLTFLLFNSFYMIVVPSFFRFMLKGQIRADQQRRREFFDRAMSEIERLEKEYADIRAMLDVLPPEERANYDERVKGYAANIAALYHLLGELPK